MLWLLINVGLQICNERQPGFTKYLHYTNHETEIEISIERSRSYDEQQLSVVVDSLLQVRELWRVILKTSGPRVHNASIDVLVETLFQCICRLKFLCLTAF